MVEKQVVRLSGKDGQLTLRDVYKIAELLDPPFEAPTVPGEVEGDTVDARCSDYKSKELVITIKYQPRTGPLAPEKPKLRPPGLERAKTIGFDQTRLEACGTKGLVSKIELSGFQPPEDVELDTGRLLVSMQVGWPHELYPQCQKASPQIEDTSSLRSRSHLKSKGASPLKDLPLKEPPVSATHASSSPPPCPLSRHSSHHSNNGSVSRRNDRASLNHKHSYKPSDDSRSPLFCEKQPSSEGGTLAAEEALSEEAEKRKKTLSKGSDGRATGKNPSPEDMFRADTSTVVIGVLVILLYFGVGISFYTNVEDWTIVDALYFSVVTLTTVGYGDLVPTSDKSKLFTIVFSFIGIGIIAAGLGFVVGEILVRHSNVDHAKAEREKAKKPPENQRKQRIQFMLRHVILPIVSIIVMILAGALLFYYEEDTTMMDAVYASAISLTTIGYGDYSPQNEAGRIVSTAWLLVGVVVVGWSLSGISDSLIIMRQESIRTRILDHRVSMRDLRAMDDGDGRVTESEFILFMLQSMQLVEEDDVRKIRRRFVELDADGSGYLSSADLKLLELNEQASAR
eukprot:Rmarinus@m.10785